jgi:hypothetical protein
MKLSFLSKTYISLLIITALALIVVWTIIRPNYKASVLEERLATVQQFQNYSIDNLDRTITSWLEVTRLLALQVAKHPTDGEVILRSTMSLHPDIIQIKIESMYLSDELASQNTLYPTVNLQIADSSWLRSKLDTVNQITWFAQAASPRQLFVSRTQFWAEKIPFTLTVVWNAQQLIDIFAGMSLKKDISLSIHSRSAMIVRNDSSYKINKILDMVDKMDSIRSVQEGTATWHVFKSPFHSVELWMVSAVPENTIIKPVEQFMIYSTSLILGLVIIIFIFEWLFTLKIKRIIKKLKAQLSAVNKL